MRWVHQVCAGCTRALGAGCTQRTELVRWAQHVCAECTSQGLLRGGRLTPASTSPVSGSATRLIASFTRLYFVPWSVTAATCRCFPFDRPWCGSNWTSFQSASIRLLKTTAVSVEGADPSNESAFKSTTAFAAAAPPPPLPPFLSLSPLPPPLPPRAAWPSRRRAPPQRVPCTLCLYACFSSQRALSLRSTCSQCTLR